MSISSRIWEMNNHLLADYEVLTLAGADLTNVDKNIVNLKMSWKERLLYFMNNGTDDVWNNWNKVSGTGTTLSLNNTEEAPMSLTYKGNTSQNGTPTPTTPIPVQVVSGDNSIEVSTNINNKGIRLGLYQIANGEYASPTSGNRYATFNDLLEVQPNTTYKVKTTNNINAQFYQLQYNESKTYLSNSSSAQSVKDYTFTTSATTKYLAIDIRAYDMTNITTDYVGGIEVIDTKASYPINLGDIELCKIGTYQDKIDKSSGKNIFDNSVEKKSAYPSTTVGSTVTYYTSSASYSYVNGCYVEAGKTYTFSCKLNTPASTTYRDSVIVDNNNIVLEHFYLWKNATSVTYTPSHSGYLILCVDNNSTELMINEGDTALPYEPYGTSWYLKKEIGKVVLNGSENWSVGTRSDNTTKFFYRIYNEILTNNTGVGNEYSNYFRIENPYTSLNDSMWMFKQGNVTALRLGFSNQDIITEAGLQSWLSTHNTDLYYPLATPTYDKITDTTLLEQLEAMKQSYDSQTNISQTNNDLPFELSVTALEVMS